jgi:hypothetical protein
VLFIIWLKHIYLFALHCTCRNRRCNLNDLFNNLDAELFNSMVIKWLVSNNAFIIPCTHTPQRCNHPDISLYDAKRFLDIYVGTLQYIVTLQALDIFLLMEEKML